MRALALSCLLLAPLGAPAADWSFRRAVADIEEEAGTRRVRIPMWGVMKFVAYPAYRPMGVKDFDMVIFEDAHRLRRVQQRFFSRLGSDWRPMLRVHKRGGDSVTIYARDEGSWVRMLMLTAGDSDAVLMQFKIRPSRLMVFLSHTAAREARH
jgi:hypothetical protein